MRKSVLFVAIILMSGICGSLLIADEMCVPMGNITLATLAEEGKRADVEFPHAVHFGYSCEECHHTWNRTDAIDSCTTSGCHDLEKAPVTDSGKPVKDPDEQIQYFKKAYHDKCIGCHREIKRANKAQEASKTALGQKLAPVGPTGCNGCHPKA